MSGLVCDKCRTIIKYLDAITEEDRQSDYHLCERCNPKPERIIEVYDAPINYPIGKRNKTRKKSST